MLRVILESSPSSSPLWRWAWPRWEVFSAGSWSSDWVYGWPKERTLTPQARSPNERLAGVRLARGERNSKRYHWFRKESARWVDRRVWVVIMRSQKARRVYPTESLGRGRLGVGDDSALRTLQRSEGS